MTILTEASPLDKIIPGFQKQARGLATARGASSDTREGKLALLTILFDLDIIDSSVIKMFKNDPSVSRMVTYFEENGIARTIKQRMDDIQSYIKDQLENKISFTTGNRTDDAQQRMELNRLDAELKAAKKVARIEHKSEVASALSTMSQSVEQLPMMTGASKNEVDYTTDDYMLEIAMDARSDHHDTEKVIDYLKQFVDEDDIDVSITGRVLDFVFSSDSRLGKMLNRYDNAEEFEKSIASVLKRRGVNAAVILHDTSEEMSTAADVEYEEEAEDAIGRYDSFDDIPQSEYDNKSITKHDIDRLMLSPQERAAKEAAAQDLDVRYRHNVRYRHKFPEEEAEDAVGANFDKVDKSLGKMPARVRATMTDVLASALKRYQGKEAPTTVTEARILEYLNEGFGSRLDKFKRGAKTAAVVGGLVAGGIGADKAARYIDQRAGRESSIEAGASNQSPGQKAAYKELEDAKQEYKAVRDEAIRWPSWIPRADRLEIKYNELKRQYEDKYGVKKESVAGVMSYMSEQKVYSTPKPIVESISFRERFKPKTDKQLAELKNYGM